MQFKRKLKLLQYLYSNFSSHLPKIQLFISTWEKSYEDIYHSPPHVYVVTGSILVTMIRFACYHLPRFRQHFHDWLYVLKDNSDLSKLEWTLLLLNFNCIRDLTNRRRLFSIPVAEYAFFSPLARTLKNNLLVLISNFSKYYFKTGTICLLFFSSHVFNTLEFDSNHFGILLWKIVKPRDQNEIKPPIEKIFWKYKPIWHFFVCPENNCRNDL